MASLDSATPHESHQDQYSRLAFDLDLAFGVAWARPDKGVNDLFLFGE